MANLENLLNLDDVFNDNKVQETDMKVIRECIQELRKDNAYDFVEENYDRLSKEDIKNLLMAFIMLTQENELEQDYVADEMEVIYYQ